MGAGNNPVLEPGRGLPALPELITMLVNETEWPAIVTGRMSYGKCRIDTQTVANPTAGFQQP